MEEKAKSDDGRYGPLGPELQGQAKNDPEFAKKMEAARRITERYSDALQRLADS